MQVAIASSLESQSSLDDCQSNGKLVRLALQGVSSTLLRGCRLRNFQAASLPKHEDREPFLAVLQGTMTLTFPFDYATLRDSGGVSLRVQRLSRCR